MRVTDHRSIFSRRLFLFLATLLAALPASTSAAVTDFTIEAPDFDEGNVRVSLPGQAYAGGAACIWNGGTLPNRAVYEIDFPVAADFTLSALYTAAQSRPVEIGLDGKKIHTGLKSVTGDWNTRSARWEQQCTFPITRGKHTISLQSEGPMPHLCALRLHSSVPLPDGWQRPRPAGHVGGCRIRGPQLSESDLDPADPLGQRDRRALRAAGPRASRPALPARRRSDRARRAS